MSSWYNELGADNDIVLSTRIRLARNLSCLPFVSRMTDEQNEQLKQKVKEAITQSNTPFAKTLKYIDMSAVPKNEINAMVERHIISPEFAKKAADKALVISDDESISIMIGEEDHIRIQIILGGLQLEKAYTIVEQLDSILDASLHFAFDNELGYLTECPTNLGTGLRASVMMHLPISEKTGEISRISENARKIGFTVRGTYGEGTKAAASLYQISNQVTLGISEKNAIDNLKIIATGILEKENAARDSLDRITLEDSVFRALGTLKNARILSSEEMIDLLSLIKLGTSMGILNKEINSIKLLIEEKPYMLMKKHGEVTPRERDVLRATDIREALMQF